MGPDKEVKSPLTLILLRFWKFPVPQPAPRLQLYIVCAQLCNEVPVDWMLSLIIVILLQALEWIHDTGEFYLSTHTSTGSSIHHTQELLKEHEDFQITAKVCVVECLFVTVLLCKRRRRGWKPYIHIFMPVVVLCVCLHSPVLCCEAHSQGGVLSSPLTAVSLLLCQRINYCVHQANTLKPDVLFISYLPFLHRCCGHLSSLSPP